MNFAKSTSAWATIGLLAAWLAPATALAQTRSATSPLDEPQTTDIAPPPARDVAPPPGASPAAMPAPPSPAEPPLSLPVPTGEVAPPVALEDLLPEGISSAGGMTEADVVARARETSLAVRQADARGAAAQASVSVAERSFLPQATLGARYTRLSSFTPGTIPTFDTVECVRNLADCQQMPQNYVDNAVLQEPILNQYALSARLDLPLSDMLGTYRHGLTAAREDQTAARELSRGARQDAELVALQAYWELLRARAQDVMARDAAELAQRRLADAEARRASGVATESEVLATRADAEAYGQLVLVASSRVAVAEQSLRDLLELPADDPLALQAELAPAAIPPQEDMAALRAQAVQNTASVRAARHATLAAEARARLERSRMIPRLSAAFNYDYANPNPRIFPQTTTFQGTWDASVQLTWSIDGTLISQARLSAQLAQAEDSRLGTVQGEREAGRSVLLAHGQLVAAVAQVRARAMASASAEERVRMVRARQSSGVSTATELRQAESTALRARLDWVDALVDAQLAHASYRRALGSSAWSEAAADGS